ncbi:MAG: adenylate kinase [Cyclobacteriaceae bacterium]|nr:adenylate kinase [Cyclobacteriaceae bacterium]
MVNIVLFGPPGAGKGTQSEKLIEKYGFKHLSTGDLFRKHLSEGTELGELAKKYMHEGKLVPDSVVVGMVEDAVKSNTNTSGIIFDGFPRTVAQAEALDKILSDNGMAISGMVALKVPDEELKTRLLGRGKTSGRADDQDEEKINTRIRVYYEETEPVIGFYDQQKKYTEIAGLGGIEAIFERICSIIDQY